uniref:DNA-directed RNA polymerase subunit beta' n=1 Tax=Dunaliella salina TaxID=3046 RepID=D0FXV5_DUNSA|nr:beta' subunit of RNA polymerase [Dunaliella salina]ACS95038.1 beta' subunit of RNA polymerase [Dunaliella salina]
MNYFNSYGIRMLPSYIARIQKNVIFKDKIFYKKNFISSSGINTKGIYTFTKTEGALMGWGKTKNYNNFSTNGLSPSREYSNTYASTGFGTRGTLVVPNSQKINVKENKKYNFQKRLYTSYSKFTEVKLVTIGIASPLRILQWAEKTLPNGKIYGEVLNANTLHHKTFKPQKGGLFCERIFGPLKDFECSCGKIDKTAKYSLQKTEQKPDEPARNNKNLLEETIQDNNKNKPKKSLGELSFGITKDKSKTTRKLRKFCPDCDVEYTWSVIRRYQLGYIKLISPVTHVWFLKGTPSYLSILLDIKKRFLQSITYCSETLTIEHSGSAATALQSYKISGGFVDLDSPSKIYASWSKAKSMATSSNENSDMNAAGSNSEKLISYSENNNNPVYSANPPSINSNGRPHGALKKDNILDYRTKRIHTINKWKNTIKISDGQNNEVVLSLGKNQGYPHGFPTKNKMLNSAFFAELPKFDSQNKGREFSINKTSQLLTFFQKPIKEKNIKTREKIHININNVNFLNLYENILSEFGIVNSEIRFFMLQFIYILQLGLIYNDLIQNLFSDKIFNIETFLIQKMMDKTTRENLQSGKTEGALTNFRLYEKQGLIDRESVLRNSEISYLKNENFDKNDFLHLNKNKMNSVNFESNLRSNAKEEINFNNYSPDLKIETFGSSQLINKINKKSSIDLYIKANLQRMLYKKIIMHSIVKTWQKIYKKAYIKAMYKTIYYFLQTNQMVDSKHKLQRNFLRNQTKQNKNNQRADFKVSSARIAERTIGKKISEGNFLNSKEISNNGTLNNFDIFFHYYKINKMYASKTSLKYLKNIIRLVKSYFKKNTLLTLQNIKQPIFNLHLQNTKNYTQIFHRKNSTSGLASLVRSDRRADDTEKILGGPASSAFVRADFKVSSARIAERAIGKFSNLTPNILLDNKISSLKPGGFGSSHVNFCYTYIPIPYSIPQLINKKSEEMTDFLSLDISSLVDLLAENGFIAPLVVGKFFEQTRYNTISNYESYISTSYPPLTQTKPNQIQTNENLSYKRQLFTIAKNLLKENQNDVYFNYNKFLLNKREENLPPEEGKFSKKDSDLLDGSSSVSAEFIPTHLFRTSKLKTDISKLLSSRLLKQPYLDLYSLNNGNANKKDPIKNNININNVYSSYMNFPITFASEKDNPITKTEYKKNKQIKENYAMKELSKNSPINNNRSRVLETPPAPKKRLYNNVYTLSHRERWGSRVNEGKDWQIFLLYNTAVSNSKDQPIFAYKERISLTAFNSQIYRSYKNSTKENLQTKFSSSQLQNSGLITPREGSIARSSIRPDENQKSALYQNQSVYQNKQPYGVLINNSFFSGPGIIQQLLSELTFSEMKKLDKQNRLLLYVLNKSIFKLKKHVKIFIYDKASQIEMRELCKKRDLLIRRTKLVRKLFRKDSDPSSMILTVLPVLPPDLRPIVKMGGQIAASDLNRFYQRVIYRNDRLKKFLKDPATSNSYEMKYAQRLLQEAVDNLIQNSQSSGEKDSRGRALKSLSDILKGKQGRFRQFLLGKRVDYSGRSVIVVGPKLKLYQCGIPVEMALELYLPFLLKIILNKNYAKTVVGAKALIKNNRPLALELLREIMQVSPVLLNRAPTLHRLGFQAFVPKLVEGRAILLHPLVCSSFNADFDGDQMAVHVPITIEARAEAWKLMLSRNNMLSPATGDPLSIPSQDMVLGCYYLTTNSNKATLSLLRGSGFFFTDLQKVLYQYDLQQIDLHALVWVKWSGLIENGNDQEEPLEIRLSTTGHWQELSYNYIRHFDSSSQLIHQYMSTTPGRILFYSLLQSI